MLWCCVATIGTVEIGMPLIGVKVRLTTQGEVKKRAPIGLLIMKLSKPPRFWDLSLGSFKFSKKVWE